MPFFFFIIPSSLCWKTRKIKVFFLIHHKKMPFHSFFHYSFTTLLKKMYFFSSSITGKKEQPFFFILHTIEKKLTSFPKCVKKKLSYSSLLYVDKMLFLLPCLLSCSCSLVPVSSSCFPVSCSCFTLCRIMLFLLPCLLSCSYPVSCSCYTPFCRPVVPKLSCLMSPFRFL